MDNGLVNGFKAVAIPLNGVGKVVEGNKGVNLSDIVPLGADTITGNVTLQKLNASGGAEGGTVYEYHKNDPKVARGKAVYPNNGWYNGATYITPDGATDVEIAAGAAVWVKGTSDIDIQVITPFEDL